MTRKKDAGRLPAADDERRAFEQAMDGTRPLAADRRRNRGDLPPGPRPERPPSLTPAPQSPVRLRAIEAAGSGPDDRYAYLADGESTDRLRELRSGRARPEAELDLHGQTTVAASAALARFLENARQQGRRLLLVIHGRGRGSGPAGPVLRQQVIAQLSEGPLAAEVLALVTAPPAQGGAGAALVLLRRRR